MSEVVNLLFLVTGAGLGAGLTYFVQTKTQERAWKREDALTMREEVYGPIYKELNKVLENLESLEPVDLLEGGIPSALKKTMDHHLFYRIEKDLKSRLYVFLNRFEKYETLYRALQSRVLDIMKTVIEETYRLDIGRHLGMVTLNLKLEHIFVGSLTLEQAVIREAVPKDFVDAGKNEWGENVFVDVNVAGNKVDLSDFQSLYENVLSKVRDETLFQEEKRQRKVLIPELEGFLQQIEKHLEID